jgi:ribosomal-protein-alanine N-acetyltransferase
MDDSFERVRLQGAVVLLRPSTESDYPAIARILSDAAVMQYLKQLSAGAGGWTVGQVADREGAFARLRKQRRALEFAVVDARSQAVVGTCGFHLFAFANRSALFGLILDKAVWGKGVAAECHLLCFGHAFGELGMHRIEMETDSRNARMRAFYERLALGPEFVRKEAVFEDGAFYDTCGYACLERDWPRVREALVAVRDRQT